MFCVDEVDNESSVDAVSVVEILSEVTSVELFAELSDTDDEVAFHDGKYFPSSNSVSTSIP